jgi:CubicO group peptidase (beta-lactamase class C family)
MTDILCLISVLLGLAVPIQASVSEFAAQLQKKMPSLLARYNIPGAEIAYIHNGEVAWSQAYGTLSAYTHEPLRPGLVFNFGSCGKVLTAWGIMRLVDQGKIDLDVPANRKDQAFQRFLGALLGMETNNVRGAKCGSNESKPI